MKTANKILLTALGILFIVIIAVFITLRIELSREAHKGSGHIVTEERSLAGFTEIEARGNLIIHIEQSENHNVMIEADDNLIEFVETTVSRGRLRIRLTEPIRSKSHINLYVQLQDLSRLEGNAGSHFISNEGLHGTVLTKELGSGARSALYLFYDELNVILKSGSFSNLSGSTNDFSVEVTSGAVIDASRLEALTCKVISKSGAEAFVFVSESLTANASSGGLINYHGNPAHKSWNTSGGGQIIKK